MNNKFLQFNKSNSILVVEDEPSLAKILKFDLETAGYQVTIAIDGETGYLLAKDDHYQCLIIDWMLPKMSGLDLIKKLRQEKLHTLIVMLTARTSEFDAIEALSGGADLYIKKPISNRELIAQLKALVDLSKKENILNKEVLIFGNVTLDLKQYKAFIDNKMIDITKLEFELLKFFIVNKEQVLSRDTILNAVWGFVYDGKTRIVDVHINKLKNKLKVSRCVFEPVRGVGYALLLK